MGAVCITVTELGLSYGPCNGFENNKLFQWLRMAAKEVRIKTVSSVLVFV